MINNDHNLKGYNIVAKFLPNSNRNKRHQPKYTVTNVTITCNNLVQRMSQESAAAAAAADKVVNIMN